jgi:cupin 2 domain-containing protein
MSKPNINNLFASLPDELPEELVTVLADRDNVRIEHIVSRGHASEEGVWYDQADDEFVLMLTGSATLEFEGEGEVKHLAPGDWLLIPAGCRHRVAATNETIDTHWLAVFISP